MKLWQRYAIFITAFFLFGLIYLLFLDWSDTNDAGEQADQKVLASYYNLEEIRFLQDERKWKQSEM
jgi:hypothetical protein